LEKEPLEAGRLRDRFSIIAEMLVVAKDGSLKPQVIYRVDLSLAQLNEYLSRALTCAKEIRCACTF
jgi:predicted transcriptional regulator